MKFSVLGAIFLSVVTVSSCGDDEESPADIIQGITGIGNANSVNGLADAYPHSLTASIFPTGVTATDGDGLGLVNTDEEKRKTTSDKLRETDQILRGEADSCFQAQRFEEPQVSDITCYQFDNDMNPFERSNPAEQSGTTNGQHTDGEACLVAFTRQQIGDSVQEVERALSLVSAMICQVKKNGGDTTPPAIDEEKEYTTDLSGVAGSRTPITSATMTRLADNDGRAVYKTDISFSDPKGIPLQLTLVHSPGATAAEDEGTLNLVGPALPPGQQGGNSENNEANMNRVMSIKYAGSLVENEERMRMRVARAQMLNTITPFDETGEINYAGIPEGEGNSTSNNFDLTEFDINPDTNEGNFAYWRNPGGSFHEAARGFLFEVTRQDSGALQGCGVSGAVGVGNMDASTSIREHSLDRSVEANELKPKNYWHPFAGDNTNSDADPRYTSDSGSFFTKQCFIQNAESGVYEIDTAVLDDDNDRNKAEAIQRGYSVLPGETLAIRPPQRPRDHNVRPPQN